MKALIAGWFSFEQMGATAGDLLARDVVARWLREAGIVFDIAVAEPFTDGIDWRQADSRDYTHILFVCGPFGNGEPVTEFLHHFEGCRLIGIDLTMLQRLEEWNPFDLLLERDSDRTARPDLVFLSPPPVTPVIGVVLVHPQEEYGQRGAHAQAEEAIHRLLREREAARVPIDTRLDVNSTGLRTAGEVEALIARTDVVVTTRLHGLVLALKNGVPVVAVDPIAGGAKVLCQAQVLGWPHVFTPDAADPAALSQALDACLSETGRQQARACRDRAIQLLADIQPTLLDAFRHDA